MPKRLVHDLLQRTLLIGRGTTIADCELPGEDADDHVYKPRAMKPARASHSKALLRTVLTASRWPTRPRASR